MRIFLLTLALLLTPPGTPSGGFRWQRTITPPASSPLAQACVVLDAATFANAAPALRDLRLFQDGAELPYAIEESYDPRALDSGITPADDRSLYEPVLTLPLTAPEKRFVGDRIIDHLYASGPLEAHVPVERLSLTAAARSPVTLDVDAAPSLSGFSEHVTVTVPPGQRSVPLTLGANLQHVANLHLRASLPLPAAAVVLEMRRRSLCYQPRSASPLTLYLGGSPGMAAKSYSYASNFSTALDRPYATLGPLTPNPADTDEAQRPPARNRRKHLLWAATLAAIFFVFSANRMLRKPPSPAREDSL